MKSVKLSLATIVAAGALTSLASATPLEQAIKDVDVSGSAWMRYDLRKRTHKYNDGARNHDSRGFWRYKAQAKFKFAIDDNFYAVLKLRYDNNDASYGERGAGASATLGGVTYFGKGDKENARKGGGADDSLDFTEYALGYKIGNTDILLGRQTVGSFLTDDMVGTGIKIVNKDITGLTLTAAFFDALEDDGDIGSNGLGRIVNNRSAGAVDTRDGRYVYQHNLYTVQANGSYNPVDFAAWYAEVASVAGLYGVDLGAHFDISDDFGLGLRGEFAGASIKNGLKNGARNANFKAGNNTFWAAEASMNLFGIDLNAGYLTYGKKDSTSLISFEDCGKFIKPAEQIIDLSGFDGRHNYWFVTAKYSFLEKYSVGFDFLSGKTKTNEGDTKQWESVARVGYNYSKKLNFWGWWSHSHNKDDFERKHEFNSDRFKFQATYKF